MFQIDERIMADNRSLISIQAEKSQIDKTLKNGTLNYVSNDYNNIYVTIPRTKQYNEFNRIIQEGPDGKIPLDLIFKGNITIEKDLIILGDKVTIDVPNLTIEDNIIELNKNETGNGITLAASGIQINRGLKGNANILFDENKQGFTFDTNGNIQMWIRENGNVDVLNDLTAKNIIANQNIRSNTLTIDGASTLKSTLRVDSATTLNDILTVVKAATLQSTLTTTGATWLKSTLQVDGATTLNNTLTATGAANLQNTLNVTGATTLNDILTTIKATWLKDTLRVDKAATFNDIVTINGATNLTGTINTTGTATFNSLVTLKNSLNVQQSADFDSTLNVDGATTLQSTLVAKGLSTIDGNNLYVKYDAVRGGGQLTVDKHAEFNHTVNIDGNTTIGGTFGVTGAVTLSNNLAVTGATNITGALTASSETNLQNTLTVSKATTLSDILTVIKAATLQSTLLVKGAATLENTLNVVGAVTLNNILNIDGITTFKDNANFNIGTDKGIVWNDTVKKHSIFVEKYGSNQTRLVFQSEDNSANNECVVFKGKTSGSSELINILSVASDKVVSHLNFDAINGIDVTGSITIDGTNTTIKKGSSNSIRIQTNSGYVDIGPNDSSYSHFNTDRSKFFFNKPLYVTGDIYAGTNYNEKVLKTTDTGHGKGLDADTIDTYHADKNATANTAVIRDLNGNIKIATQLISNNTIIKDNSGVVELRNAADNAWANLIVNNLTVKGSSSISLESVRIADNFILLNSNVTGAATVNAGINIERGTSGADASIMWDETADVWKAGLVGSEVEIGLLGTLNFNESVQDTIGSILTNTNSINLTYNDSANTITADVKVDNSTIEIDATNKYINIKNSGVTDTKIGNRTVDQATATAYSNTGTLTQILSWFAKKFKEVLGTTNWYDAIPASLKTLWDKFNASTGHKHTGGANDAPKISYTDLANIPPSFNPSAHTHTKSNITDFSHNHTSSEISNLTKTVQDTVGSMITPNPGDGINVTYNDSTGKLSFDVTDPVITLSGDVTGSATMTNLGNVNIVTTVLSGAGGSVQSVAGKTGVVTLVKADVGLGNVDNTSDLNKPISTATQTALNLKAPLASPALTGTPTAPTATTTTNTTQVATTAFVQSALSSGTISATFDKVTTNKGFVSGLCTTVYNSTTKSLDFNFS